MKSFLRIFLIFTLILSVSTSGQFAIAKEETLSYEQKIQNDQSNSFDFGKFESRLINSQSLNKQIKNALKIDAKATDLYLTSIDPLKFEKDVPRNKNITLRFNTDVKFGSGYIRVWSFGDYKDLKIDKKIVGDVLYITPLENMVSNKQYMIDLDKDAIRTSDDKYYNGLFFYSFTTGTKITPLVSASNPSHGEQNVPVNKEITVTFDKDIKLVDSSKVLILDKDSKSVPLSVSVDGSVLKIKPKNMLNSNSIYGFGIDNGAVTDSNGIPNQRYVAAFKTGTGKIEGKELESIEVSESEVEIAIGGSVDIEVTANYSDGTSEEVSGDATFESDDEDIVSVDGNTLTAESEGYATITVEYEGQTVDIDVTVSEEGSSDEIQYEVIKGHTIKLKLSGGKSPYKAVSDNSKVASVKIKSGYLEIKGVKEGSATITVSDGNKDEIEIVVDVVEGVIEF